MPFWGIFTWVHCSLRMTGVRFSRGSAIRHSCHVFQVVIVIGWNIDESLVRGSVHPAAPFQTCMGACTSIIHHHTVVPFVVLSFCFFVCLSGFSANAGMRNWLQGAMVARIPSLGTCHFVVGDIRGGESSLNGTAWVLIQCFWGSQKDGCVCKCMSFPASSPAVVESIV